MKMAREEYVSEFLQTGHSKVHFLSNVKHAILRSSIDQSNAKSLSVLMPPLSQLHEFVILVDGSRTARVQQTTTTTKAAAAVNALLPQAFSN